MEKLEGTRSSDKIFWNSIFVLSILIVASTYYAIIVKRDFTILTVEVPQETEEITE